MKYKKIGNTELQVSVIGQGCMGLRFADTLRKGIEMGMTFIDIAEAYGDGHAETLVGEASRGIRKQVFMATKFLPEHHHASEVIKAAERSLKRLRTDYIDLYQIHWPNPAVRLEETLEAMRHLVQQGKVRYLGVSNFSLKDLKRALSLAPAFPIVSNQIEYNLFDRTIENHLLPFCQQNGITIVAYSPLDQGKIINGTVGKNGLQKIADKYGKTMGQIALNWLVSQEGVIAIPKASKLHHLVENAGSVDFTLADEDKALISDLAISNPQLTDPKKISVVVDPSGGRQVYQTIGEAIENRFHMVPSPADLSMDLEGPETLKPVRLVSRSILGEFQYDLVEGRNRYWAWVIKHGWDKPVPALIRR